MHRILFIQLLLLLIPFSADAGLDEFSHLEMIDDWLVERRVDSVTNEIRCRASIPRYWAWFGSRTRLNNKDELIIARDSIEFELPSPQTIDKVKEALRLCRSSLIYSPSE